VRVMEVRKSGVRVSLGVTVSWTWGECYGGQKLGVRVSGTLVKDYGSQEFVMRAR
jgi:hypothetical protein